MGLHRPATDGPLVAFTTILATVIGFFATAGAAGVDFGMNSRNEGDVRKGGLMGIALAILIAGGLPILSVAGARAVNPAIGGFADEAVVRRPGAFLSAAMILLFSLA